VANLETPAVKRGFREKLRLRWFALWPTTIALAAYPVANRILRVAMICCVLLLVAGLLGFFWRTKWLRFAILAAIAAAGICFILPGESIDSISLRGAYIHSLKKYEGTHYVWGGENVLGIDCSGLVRAGLINAEFSEAFRTRNAALLRAGASLWWHDCSARALGDGFRQLTFHVFDAESINRINDARLQPGDLAVTDDGVHVLAYLGDKSWIEADPTLRRVLIVTLPTTNDWFDAPVKITRWQQLQTPNVP
jgi:hypothetical protein